MLIVRNLWWFFELADLVDFPEQANLLHVETQHGLKWKEMAWVPCLSPEAVETNRAIKSVEAEGRVEVDLERAVGVEGSGSMTASGEVFGGDKSGDGGDKSQTEEKLV
ncbi:Hypothetical predicted protein [Olea europaea subsp. europaea]|uniref:Uncharacterized protein n=1 Tax=Olea europaea subsp. europaea TaxID=158383 RepID=A0A8S0SF74_OLEEU|nr:Hypothetical predicted protein [Olea europaea subsp. europaea]